MSFSMSTTATVLALLASAATAQSLASFTPYGAGCAGSGGPSYPCESLNMSCSSSWGKGNANRFAIPFKRSTATSVSRISIKTASLTGNVETGYVELWETDADGVPTVRRTRAQINATSTYAARTVFTGTEWFDANAPFAVVFELPNFAHPLCASGTAVPYYYQVAGSPTWHKASQPKPWTLEVECTAQAAPRLSASPPTPGQTMTMTINDATYRGMTVFCLGASRNSWNGLPLPFDMTPLGAPSCSILASCDASLTGQANSAGWGAVQVPIPNSPSLNGAVFYTQAVVLDPPVNRLGLAFSNGGKAIVGDPCSGPPKPFSHSFSIAAPTIPPILTQPLASLSGSLNGSTQELCCGQSRGCTLSGQGILTGTLNKRVNFVAPLAVAQTVARGIGKVIEVATGGTATLTANVGIWADGIDMIGTVQAYRSPCSSTTQYSGTGNLSFRNLTAGIDLGGKFSILGIDVNLQFKATATVLADGGYTIVDGDSIQFWVKVSELYPQFAATIPQICVPFTTLCAGPWTISKSTTISTPGFDAKTPKIPLVDALANVGCN